MADRDDRTTRLLLVRHGQSTWNAAGRWQGQEDPPLSAMGERQADEAAERLDAVDAVWASDLVRARRTAEVLAARHGLTVQVDARLRERHGGPWQGLTRAQIDAEWPGYRAGTQRPDGYESDAEVSARVLEALAEIRRRQSGEVVLVVTHGGVVRTIERLLRDTTRGPGADLIPNLGGRALVADGDDGWTLGEQVLLLGEDSVTVPGQL